MKFYGYNKCSTAAQDGSEEGTEDTRAQKTVQHQRRAVQRTQHQGQAEGNDGSTGARSVGLQWAAGEATYCSGRRPRHCRLR